MRGMRGRARNQYSGRTRYDVWTDAGRDQGDMFLIGRDMSSTAMHGLYQQLEKAGWTVTYRPHDPTSRMRRT